MHALVLVTCPDKKTAEDIADLLLEKRLAACVNMVPGVTSKYWWKGKLDEGAEVLILIKTRESLVKKIERAVKENHPYETPEVVAVRMTGSSQYLGWIDSETC